MAKKKSVKRKKVVKKAKPIEAEPVIAEPKAVEPVIEPAAEPIVEVHPPTVNCAGCRRNVPFEDARKCTVCTKYACEVCSKPGSCIRCGKPLEKERKC